jgi:tRNA(adenine34) deaminase
MTGYLASFESAMRLALAAARASQTTASVESADVPVGAVLLDGAGTVIAQGHNRREATSDPSAHAEIMALRSAGQSRSNWRLADCTLVVTLEPCTMCAGALLAARVSRLVFGAADPRAGAAGSVWDVLHDPRLGPPVEVRGGVLASECGALLHAFFEKHRSASQDSG